MSNHLFCSMMYTKRNAEVECDIFVAYQHQILMKQVEQHLAQVEFIVPLHREHLENSGAFEAAFR
jgi:hypothetical protein